MRMRRQNTVVLMSSRDQWRGQSISGILVGLIVTSEADGLDPPIKLQIV